MTRFSLRPHPSEPSSIVTKLFVELTDHGDGQYVAQYTVFGNIALLKIPTVAVPERADNLWQMTCFEVFLADASGGYTEYNFSPSTQWACYHFSDYRMGMANAIPPSPPAISSDVTEERLEVSAAFTAMGPFSEIALSAIIEARDGSKSYWALKHSPGPPDFHHPDCFALSLAAPEHP
jgi:hypothetical protein